MFRRFYTSVAIPALFFLCCTTISPSSLEALVASVKATGMGAVGVAYPQDALAGVYNPAGIVDVGDRIDAGIAWIHDQGSATISGNRSPLAPLVNGTFEAYGTKDMYSPDFGINKSFCMDSWGFAVGLVVYNRNATKTTYETNFPLLGQSNLGMEYIHETISPMIAAKYCEHSLGLSVNYMIQRIKVNGLERLNTPLFTKYAGYVTNRGYSYSNGIGVTLGWKWDILPCLSIGASFQPTTKMNHFGKYKGFLAQKGLLKIPPIVTGGITYRFADCASASFDVQYLGWNRIRAVHNPAQPNLFSSKLGATEGAGFGWRSQWIYRFGTDWDICPSLTVRAGCRFSRSVAGPSQTAVNLLTNDPVGNFVMGGFSWRPLALTELSLYYAHGFKREIYGKHSIPAAFGGGEADLKQQKQVLAISLGINY